MTSAQLAGRLSKPRNLVVAVTIGALAVALVVTLSWRSDGDARGSDVAYEAEIERVISGHSVKLDSGERLNYAAIRTPYQNEPFHDEARERNAELVNGKEVRLRYDEADRDRKDRLLAYVSVGGEFVNEILVREGLAYVRLTPGARRFANQLLEAQRDAREDKRGIWSARPRTRESHYPADPKYGNFHRPSCEEVPKINPERLTTFNSREQAFDAGFAPCSTCLP